jgi:hypothetical protein
MAAMYGVLVAMPVMWGWAGYVMVSHPGTAESKVSHAHWKVAARPGK